MNDFCDLLDPLTEQARLAVACACVEHVTDLYRKGGFRYSVGAAAKPLGATAKADMIDAALTLAWRSAESATPVGSKVFEAFEAGTSDPPEGMEREEMSTPALQVVDAVELLLETTQDATSQAVAKLLESCIDALSDMAEGLEEADDDVAERVCGREEAWQAKVIAHVAKVGKKPIKRAVLKELLDKPPAWRAQLAKYEKSKTAAAPMKSTAKASGKAKAKPKKRVPNLTFDQLERVWPKLGKPARVAIACVALERILEPHRFGNYKLTLKDLGATSLKHDLDKDIVQVALELGWGFVGGKPADQPTLVAVDSWIKTNLLHKGGNMRKSQAARCAYKAAYYLLREIRCEQVREDAGYSTEQALSMASVGIAIDIRNAGIGDERNDIASAIEENEQAWQLRVVEHALATGKKPMTRETFEELLEETPSWQPYVERLERKYAR
jgi:hypothetical protein